MMDAKKVLKILIELEKRGLVRMIGSKDPKKAKWGRTKFGNEVLKEMEKKVGRSG